MFKVSRKCLKVRAFEYLAQGYKMTKCRKIVGSLAKEYQEAQPVFAV